MDKVEKAVIDLNGEWPDKDKKRLHDFCGKVICTHSEFMEARKRLENKPVWDTAPKGANWLTQDEAGNYSFWSHKPYYRRKSGSWVADDGPAWTVASKGCVFGDWRQSLERRPQPDHKEGEGVEWDGDMPPVGVWVDLVNEDEHVEVMCHGKGTKFCGRDKDGFIGIFDAEFAEPIQSHRDKCIEAAHKACPDYIDDAILYDLYDAGLLRLPNDKEGE